MALLVPTDSTIGINRIFYRHRWNYYGSIDTGRQTYHLYWYQWTGTPALLLPADSSIGINRTFTGTCQLLSSLTGTDVLILGRDRYLIVLVSTFHFFRIASLYLIFSFTLDNPKYTNPINFGSVALINRESTYLWHELLGAHPGI